MSVCLPSAHGLLATHPIAPFVSVHHLQAVGSLLPSLNLLGSLELCTEAMSSGHQSLLQHAVFCCDWICKCSEWAYTAWDRINHGIDGNITMGSYMTLKGSRLLPSIHSSACWERNPSLERSVAEKLAYGA